MYDTHDMQQETFCSLNVAGTSLGRQFALLQHQLLGFQLEDGHCWEGSCGLLSIVYNAKGGLHCWEGSCRLLHCHMPSRQ